ncbi:PREDICTED: methyl-CpG-binding domain-containing protein 7-like isoform X2 [Lupinus angustifolius]|uniref:methyl-CpG-binding domain-containing protein 7-like isoform X2 n=1 Tax=Lupinus angustifolius TaxID=3871 RepID=UPI00092FD0C1|nr:PREDICTED: methyl-CpG-binding domain-containing protein 7-like isoform X2 [Lupinus angustifolius]
MQCVKSSSQSFTLPHGWFIEEKPRSSNPNIKDRYYYEPGTGRKFRSLLSVQRYLTHGIIDDRSRTSGSIIPQNQNTMQIITHSRKNSSFIELPNDWIVKKKPRNNNYGAGVTDTTDIEPGTGRRFRSLKAVERYLAGENGCTAITKSGVKPRTGNQRSSFAEEEKNTLKASMHSTKSTVFNSPKEINSGTDNRPCMHNLSKPPAKVKWVLSGSGGCWNPFLDDSIVPDSEKLKWSEAFVLSINS